MYKYPKISVITPSYNQKKFIAKTIDSVLDQNYPDLEYIIMDGGSRDGTVEVLKKYGKRIKWISKKDRGQSDAINKGFKTAQGDVLCFINSDDYFLPDAFIRVAEYFQKHRGMRWVTGKCLTVDESNNEVRKLITIYKNFFVKYLRYGKLLHIVNFISQPSTFWKREILDEVGFFDEKLNYSMDYDYWLRIIQKYKLGFIDANLSCYRVHERSKAVISPEKQFTSEFSISQKYQHSSLISLMHKIHYILAIKTYRKFFIK